MKPEDIQNALADIGEDLIENAADAKPKRIKRHIKKWQAILAATLAVSILLGAFLIPKINSGNHDIPKIDYPIISGPNIDPHTILAAQYPVCAPFPDYSLQKDNCDLYQTLWNAWQEQEFEKRKLFNQTDLEMNNFSIDIFQELLSKSKNENLVYSPINLYLALSMAAEISDGNARQELLNLLGVSDIDSLRNQINSLWLSHYSDDGIEKLLLANSVWLNQNLTYKQEVLNILAEKYYASSFQGTVGSEEYNKLYRDWLNEQTGGFLNDRVQSEEIDPRTVIMLASTIYFQARWQSEFVKQKNVIEKFYTPNRSVKCEYLRTTKNMYYYWGSDFSAIELYFNSGSSMWFILPDKGVSISKLMQSSEVTEFLKDKKNWNQKKEMEVDLFMPKFDITSQNDLENIVRKLGASEIFQLDNNAFSPISELEGIYVNKITQNTRVAIDEQGCEAASYTQIIYYTGGMPQDQEKVEFKLNRPFLFLVSSTYDTPLFMGVVNDPTRSE